MYENVAGVFTIMGCIVSAILLGYYWDKIKYGDDKPYFVVVAILGPFIIAAVWPVLLFAVPFALIFFITYKITNRKKKKVLDKKHQMV